MNRKNKQYHFLYNYKSTDQDFKAVLEKHCLIYLNKINHETSL